MNINVGITAVVNIREKCVLFVVALVDIHALRAKISYL